MNAREFKELLDRYARGECSEEEEKLILDWYENIGSRRLEKFDEGEKEAIEAALWSKIRPPRGAITPWRRHLYPLAGAAAAVVVLALGGFWAYNILSQRPAGEQSIAGHEHRMSIDGTFINDQNTPYNLTLEDGSEVSLMPRSRIRVFNRSTAHEKREVYLSGAASFNVVHDAARPFMVYTGEVVTRVLGTTFSVKAYENEKEITVAVEKGKVSVYSSHKDKPVVKGSESKEVILTPNQQLIYNRDNDLASKQLVAEPQIILPKSTLFEMRYDGAPVARIFDGLEQNYGVEIVYDEKNLRQCILTTSMSDEGFVERLEVICKAINATYTVSDAVVYIESHGCK